MPLNTRARKREPVSAVVEFAIREYAEKSMKLNLPKAAIESAGAETAFIKAQLLDISVTGCGIDSPYLVPTGVGLDLKIDAAAFNAAGAVGAKEPLRASGAVTSCTMKSQGHYRLGVKFTAIDKKCVDIIDDLIKSRERRQDPRADLTK